MKRGKDEEKNMGPMFPRLHINDTDKGGPRAPPRNKMALYEQLSIPSQRFGHVALPSNPSNNSAPPPSQGGGNNRGMFLSHQVPLRHHQIEKQYTQYSNQSTLSSQGEQRQRLDDDDYTVPVFIHSTPTNEFDKKHCQEKHSNTNPSYFRDSSNFQKVQDSGIFEGKNKKGENPRQLISNWSKSSSNSSCAEKTRGDNPVNRTARLRNDDSFQSELYADSDRCSTVVLVDPTSAEERETLFNSKKSEDGNNVRDMSNNTGSHEDESCRPPQNGNLERGDSVSETSILNEVSGVDVTPDDVIGVIGQKHFWKARKAIVNQQRVFAVQVFELHRLIKVQKLIAASPHILLEDSSYFQKPTTPSPHRTKRPSDYTLKPTPNPSKRNTHPESPTHDKECSAENTLGKSSLPSPQNNKTPPPPSPSIASDNNGNFNQQPPQGQHQWLIPVMSPSEGLIYKPYPAPGSFFGQACPPSGPNPSAYGFPMPAQHYPFSSFPHFGAHGYFPPYPMMSQHDHSAVVLPQNRKIESGSAQSCASEETESSPGERRVGLAVEGKNDMLLLFPTTPAESVPRTDGPKRVARVIKVVPRNGVSASESAARIFRSIQEERKQYDDSV